MILTQTIKHLILILIILNDVTTLFTPSRWFSLIKRKAVTLKMATANHHIINLLILIA